jgi:hypothetical protein
MQQGMYNAFFNGVILLSFDFLSTFKHSAPMIQGSIREATSRLRTSLVSLANLNSRISFSRGQYDLATTDTAMTKTIQKDN